MMKPIKHLAAAMALLFAGMVSLVPAKAADPYNPTIPEIADADVVATGTDWTGFYAGLLIGYGWGDQDHDVDFFGHPVPEVDDFLSHEPNGFLFGGTIGINYQIPNTRIVTGLEGDWSYANHDDGNIDPIEGDLHFFSETEINSIGTSRVRVGYLLNENALLYATGGAAWASVRTEAGIASDEGKISLEEEDTNVGWTVGTGLEYKLDDVWSVKADYLYVDLADTEHTVHFGEHTVTLTDDLTEHMVRVGVNAKLF